MGTFHTDRELFKNPIWKNITEFRLFFLIYGSAIFAEEGYRVSEDLFLNRGQWCRSTRKLQEDLTFIENRQIKTYSTSTINRCIKSLVQSQRICTKTHELGTVFTVLNYDMYQGFGSNKKGNLERNLEQSQNSNETVSEQSSNNNKKENKEKKVNKENNKELIAEIINYLNESTGKLFSADTKESIKLISGRLKDGRTVEQFKKVIDIKTKEWLHAEKTNVWLKPSTLFAQSNFESYINQIPKSLSHDEVDEIARRKWMNAGNDPADFKGADRSGGDERSTKTNTKPGASLDGWEALVNIH